MVWDTSFLIDERTGFGQLVSSMTGYESAPSLMVVLALAVFWSTALLLLWTLGSRPAPTKA
jgi:high-affinity Fe2+/Pb2+ permease